MPEPMKPEDVPDELAAILERAIYAMPRIEMTGRIARVALAAVLPARDAQIEREVRAKVAADIEREADKVCHDDPRANGMMTAAEIARGEA